MERECDGRISRLVNALDRAVAADCAETCCAGVKGALVEAVRGGADFLEPRLTATAPDCYARRLLHLDPAGRYSVVVMVWGPDQGTPVHDHAGSWCVECVYQGRIRITSYRPLNGVSGDLVRFEEEAVVSAEACEAGALIPPFEHHKIENRDPDPAVTIHVYRGEMKRCNTFFPNGDGTYRKVERELAYTP